MKAGANSHIILLHERHTQKPDIMPLCVMRLKWNFPCAPLSTQLDPGITITRVAQLRTRVERVESGREET